MSASTQHSHAVAAVMPCKRAPRTSISVDTTVDVDIEQFDDDAVLFTCFALAMFCHAMGLL